LRKNPTFPIPAGFSFARSVTARERSGLLWISLEEWFIFPPHSTSKTSHSKNVAGPEKPFFRRRRIHRLPVKETSHMQRTACVLFGFCTISTLLGCGFQSEPASREAGGGLAIVDLDAVAQRLGRDIQIKDAVSKKETELNEQLNALKTKLSARFDETRQGHGTEPTDKQQAELRTLESQMNLQLAKAKQQALNTLSVHQQRLVAQFREEVKPIARAAAAERGLSIVIPKNEGLLLSFDPGVDITDRVAEKLKSQVPALPAERISQAGAAAKMSGN
jgi:Skp family chaperone for outer membrane proteins